MKLTYLFFSFAVANLYKATVDGALWIEDTVFCSRFAPNKNATVCAVATYSSPYLETLENGTDVYLGGYKSIYTVVKGLKEGDDLSQNGLQPENAGRKITVARNMSDVCTVSVTWKNGMKKFCNKCEYCGENSYKADCSNLRKGRNMTSCVELAKGWYQDKSPASIFFPFNANAVPKVNAPRTMKPTSAPRTNSPTRAPRTMSPTRAPRTYQPRDPESVFCSRIAPNENATVCAVAGFSNPYPDDSCGNGIDGMCGGYKYIYTIVKGLKEGDSYGDYGWEPEHDAGIVVRVEIVEDLSSCTVSVEDSVYIGNEATFCNKCEYCGDHSYKADCSNLENGRNITSCVELASGWYQDWPASIFFPFNASAISKEMAPRTISPTRAP